MSAWIKQKPTDPGVYAIRGYAIGKPRERAIVEVVHRGGELRCNLHSSTTEWPLDRRYDCWLSEMCADFEWRWIGALPEQPAVPDRSRQLDSLIEAVELRMAIAAAYNPLPAERRRLGLLAGIPAEAGTPVMGQLRRAANKKLEAVLAACKAGG